MQTGEFVDDFLSSQLRDRRLANRLGGIVAAIKADPSRSFPKAMSPSELLGYYRFVGNERVTFDEVLAGHIAESVARCGDESEVIIIHDTTDCECASVGFRGHFSLAVRRDRRPLGVVNAVLLRRAAQEKKAPDHGNEHDRWWHGIKASNLKIRNAVHIYDREPDDYGLFAWQVRDGIRFVARSQHDRQLAGGGKISTTARDMEAIVERLVPLAGRKRGNKSQADLKTHPMRGERLARLAISAKTIRVVNPKNRKESLPLNLVLVKEVNPPPGEMQIEWRLLTNEPIAAQEDVLQVVDTYRARWVIEEFFKSLKTGCGLEKRQHESFEAMSIALAILIPMALQALLLRSLSREDVDYTADEVLSEVQRKILAALPRTSKLPQATVRQALLAVAALGGHIKNNGDPGWITIGRGLETLREYEVGWLLATRASEM